MAESPTVSFRIPLDADEQLRILMAEQDRERSDMARRVFLAGLNALVDDPALPKFHEFEPKPGNSLRCATCGKPVREHR